MRVSDEITAEHVRAALSRLHETGVPKDARSTKFDVIDPESREHFPPKLVLSIAAGIATGKPLSRREFYGGEMTNARLRDLGFEILQKKHVDADTISLSELRPGAVLSNDQLSSAFSVVNAGGMRWSSTHNALVLIADHTKSLYDDRWEHDILYYTGMGTTGD